MIFLVFVGVGLSAASPLHYLSAFPERVHRHDDVRAPLARALLGGNNEGLNLGRPAWHGAHDVSSPTLSFGLSLRGGAKKRKNDATDATVLFVLANSFTYAVLHKAMATFGALNFVAVSCTCVFALWLIPTNQESIAVALQRPRATLLAFADAVCTQLARDKDDKAILSAKGRKAILSAIEELITPKENAFLLEDDIQKLRVKRGASFVLPSTMLVLDCDNGLDMNRLGECSKPSELAKKRSEIVILTLVDQDTFIERKQHHEAKEKSHPDSDTDTDNEVTFTSEETRVVKVQRGGRVTFPSNGILVSCDNGLGDEARGADGLDAVKPNKLAKRRQEVALRFVSETTFFKRWYERKPKVPAALRKFDTFMLNTFLAPAVWRKLRSRPLALFGSAFSHIDVEHLTGNLSMLAWAAHQAETWLGTRRFAHLYLTSAVLSRAFCCMWHAHGPFRTGGSKNPDGEALGASGAISGVMAWWCIELYKRGLTIHINDKSVSPLLFWLLYVGIDTSGLLQLGAVRALLEFFLTKLYGSSAEEGDKEKTAQKSQVGYDAHIGGALAGVLWHVIDVAVKGFAFSRLAGVRERRRGRRR